MPPIFGRWVSLAARHRATSRETGRGWIADVCRFGIALWASNPRTTGFRLHGVPGCAPCQNSSNSGRAGLTGCDASLHWYEPARFRRGCTIQAAAGRLGAAPSLGKAAAPSPFLYGSRCLFSASGAARVTPSVGWTSPSLRPGTRLNLLASDYLASKAKAPSATFSTASNPPATLNSALYLALYCVAGTTVVLGILDRTVTLTRSSTQSVFRAFDAMHHFSSPDTRGPVSFVLPILQPSHLDMTYTMLTSEPQRPLPPPTPRRPCPSASLLKNAAPSPSSPSLSCSA